MYCCYLLIIINAATTMLFKKTIKEIINLFVKLPAPSSTFVTGIC